MLNYILPGDIDADEQRRFHYIRQRAKLDRQFAMTEFEIVQFSDTLITRLVRSDAEMGVLRQEVQRLNRVVDSCERDIKAMKKMLEQFELKPPGEPHD